MRLIRRAAVAAGAAVVVLGLAVLAVSLSPASASSLSAQKAGPSRPARERGIDRSLVPFDCFRSKGERHV
jgi:hypothetical protein